MAEQFHSLIKGKEIGDKYALYNGDSAEVLQMLPSDSVHYIIYSPPFQSLYVYSNSDRDLGNCRTPAEFYEQFEFIGKELYRTLMPGRLMSFHCMNLPTSKERSFVEGRKTPWRGLRECFWSIAKGRPLNLFEMVSVDQ